MGIEMANPNILSERYASEEINEIFSPAGRIILERELWITVARAQAELGVDIPADALDRYESARIQVDLDLIESIEKRTRHDVAAKIEAFNKTAGVEGYIHLGMTSRDLSDNVDQIQIKRACRVVFGKCISILRHLIDRAHQFQSIILTARTHHQPAQATLLGRRMAMWAEELYHHTDKLESFIETYPLRGIKGPVGTQSDMLSLLGGRKKVAQLDRMVAERFGFSEMLTAPGQVYPRSLDLELLSYLCALASACENFAKGIRLMAGYELVTEGFAEGQVGSSAMPHKMNTRSCERICALAELVKMYANGASRLAGDQWEEGDVSCSAVRRVIIPDGFYAVDGLCETILTVLNEMGVYPAPIEGELNRYLPFLATAEILTTAVKKDIPREEAHRIIKEQAVFAALAMREEGQAPDLAARLSKNTVFREAGMTEQVIGAILADQRQFIGNAQEQIDAVSRKVQALLQKYPEEAKYEGGEIL
jgi:adenylosuccinate lyase